MESIVMLPFAVEDLAAAYATVNARSKKSTGQRIEGMAMPLGVGKQPPTRLMVFPLGEPPSNDARAWRFTAEDLAAVKADFDTRTEPVPILYEHGDGPRGDLAAGWIDSVEVAKDGLYANVHWTDKARAEIRAGEWGFRSPAWDGNEFTDGALGAGPLDHLALVNNPAIGGMAPVTASSQPSSQLAPPVKETQMANVEAAKKTAAAAPDRAGVIQILRDGFPDMFGSGAPDEMVAEYFGDLLEGGVEDEPADPMAPAADTKPAPAVPLFTSAEDVEKVAGATAPVETAEAAELKKQIETLTASVKALEARGLSGTIITASAADRSGDAPAETPGTSNPHDFVGGHLVAFKAHTAPSHKAAIAYLEKAHASGNRITYRDAVVAVTRKTS